MDSTTKVPKARKKPSKFKKAPGAPRRFKSAYMFYSTEKHRSIRAELKEIGRSEPTTVIAKMVSKAWKELPFAEREKFDELARKDKARYDVEKSTYTGPWRVSTKKRAPKNPAAPKRPMSAFLAYSHSKRQEAKADYPTSNNTELSRILAEKWRQAPDEDKKPFIENEQVQRQQYKEAIAVWREAEQQKADHERMQREDKAMKRADELARAGTAGVASQLLLLQDREQHLQQQQQPQGAAAAPHEQHPGTSGTTTQQPTHYPGYYGGEVGDPYRSSHQAYGVGSSLLPQQPNHQPGHEGSATQQHDEGAGGAAVLGAAYDPRYHYPYYSPYHAYHGHDGYQPWTQHHSSG
uniref:HMG box domain-containing protein n=1 Tax=Grammatophora oceanica TaxID=210454 RepID=A0A7S1UYX2_9STRA|mmetsp:Transcript_27795/g.40950  ORF Transcript_27795/g.40950 Transcript_27795/m.40950 type:complete len:350 (+) Transcript_27795:211-1260(+)|eukprot:CAMPEP_0194038214 /NCGR_PEP_ID=MMETSP0009_2-20130614/10470_1 /TAXON_ID=210454 /ORGANISM="Grammatophora oceanica, Strain CCMP 410" /LENGTH=349 /DNA_ID=CAMNT_0038680645 /DNA_START=181 /DNA_END=1230 /DNA_ORIENTATION=+